MKDKKNKEDLRDTSREDLTGYIKHLSEYISPNTGKLYKSRTVRSCFKAIKQAFKCFYLTEHILYNIAEDVFAKVKEDENVRQILSNKWNVLS